MSCAGTLLRLPSFISLVPASLGYLAAPRSILPAPLSAPLRPCLVPDVKRTDLADIDNRLRYETNGAQRFVIRLAGSASSEAPRFQCFLWNSDALRPFAPFCPRDCLMRTGQGHLALLAVFDSYPRRLFERKVYRIRTKQYSPNEI